MSALDWAGLMRAGLRELRLPPETFWRLTPAELAIMLGVEAGAGPLTRTRLEDLAARFPDEPKEADDGGYHGSGRPGHGAGGATGRCPDDDGGL